MRRFALSVLYVSIIAMMPVIAGAAGTYYNGNLYRNPQRYGNNGGGYYNSYGASRYGQNRSMATRNTAASETKKSSAKKEADSKKQGFYLDGSLSHEFANWNFEMKEAGSKLHYDDLTWNVISGEGIYYFGDSTPMQIKLGAKYGKQSGETVMIDDDISNGAYGYMDNKDPVDGSIYGTTYGYAMSIGKSSGGTQMGFNVSFGLTDFFKAGRVKITPSLGWRYFKYELSTKNNSGLTMDVFEGNSLNDPFINCIDFNGEKQCDPYVSFQFYNETETTEGETKWEDLGSGETGRIDLDDDPNVLDLTGVIAPVPETANLVELDLGDTYYYKQPGTSHKYETEWSGPYIAFDMEYVIDKNNLVNAGIELGLPKYTSTGDQPHRVDWAHPKSVEDTGGFGDAYHLGLSAMWSTAISDSTMFSLGLTYDYYNAKSADATTYLNPSYYEQLIDGYNYLIENNELSDYQIEAYQAEITKIEGYRSSGWKLEAKDEIKSVYASMGIRLGINVKF